MVELTIRFLAGRYHATGWNHHVNEGMVEWPPSPWRLLRALVAASYRLDKRPADEVLEALLTPLASSLPVYTVPAYSEGHTRHFMPLDNKGLPDDKSALIYDAFVAPGSGADKADGQLRVAWPDAKIDDAGFDLLCDLCESLSYLGRAESWAEVSVNRASGEPMHRANCRPAAKQPEHEGIRLMAVIPPEEHAAWVARAKAELGKPKTIPESLLDVLSQDTGELRRLGWSSVPGARWVVYDHQRKRVPPRRQPSKRKPPRVALIRIDGVVRPGIRKTLQVGEVLHRALVAQSKRVAPDGKPLTIFTGETADASSPPSENTGDHAAVMPLDVDGDGFIDHALVTARRVFDARAVATLRGVRRLYGVGTLELIVTVEGEWSDEEVDAMAPSHLPRALHKSARWRSVTPYVLTRYPKVTRSGRPRLRDDGEWRDGPEDQLRNELARLKLPAALVAVRRLASLSVSGVALHRFQRRRHYGGGRRSIDRAFGFEIEFAEPVRGPIAAGYGRFFGLGQFMPVAD